MKVRAGDFVRVSLPGTRFEGSCGTVERIDDRAGLTWVHLSDRGGVWSFETQNLEIIRQSGTDR